MKGGQLMYIPLISEGVICTALVCTALNIGHISETDAEKEKLQFMQRDQIYLDAVDMPPAERLEYIQNEYNTKLPGIRVSEIDGDE